MNTIRVIGIDFAKPVFQAYIWINDDSVA